MRVSLLFSLFLLELAGGLYAGLSSPPLPSRSFQSRRLCLRGGRQEEEEEEDALSNWKDVLLALEDMRRELKVFVEKEEMPETLCNSLFQCTSLQRLVITGGKLKTIPDDIGNLEELETLIISDNQLGSLPPSLARLPNLRVLEAENNELEELPGGEESWEALEVLNVANNRIADLTSLAGASKLNTLNAEKNRLREHTKVPVSGWRKLKTLSLKDNELEQFPAGIGNLQLVEVIDVQGNRIKSLPPDLGDLKEKTLRRLAIEENPLEDKNRIMKILNKGKRPIKEILDYVRKQAAVGAKSSSSSKQMQEADKEGEVKENQEQQEQEQEQEQV